jgi:hypothetical protein
LAIVLATISSASADDTGGSLSVRVTTSDGAPAGSAYLMLLSSGGIGQSERFTEPDGTYRFEDVRAGDYKLSLNYDGTTQYAHQKLDFASADTFTVKDGEDTQVDEQMLAPGGIDVKVVDAGEGGPVDTACVSVAYHGLENCAPDGGVYHFTKLGRGSDYMINVRAQDGLHMPGHVTDVAVELGRTTQVTVKLDPAAVITAKVLDRASRLPVANACVTAFTRYIQGIATGDCTSGQDHTANPVAVSDDEGTIRIGEIPAGERTLFAEPPYGDDYGIEWVGAHGGTGSQYDALKINARPGKVSRLSPILMDPPGSLSGTFVDASGGPLETTSMCANVLPQPYSGLPPRSSCSSLNGTFTISGLGPYKWPVGFSDPWGSTYGVQWPGGKLDRESAPTYKVTSGTTTDIGTKKVKKGHALAGAIVQRGGQPWQGYSWAYAYDPRTGDYLGSSPYSGSYLISPLSVPAVKLQVYAEGYGTYWYRDSTTFGGGDAVRLRPDRDTQLNIVVPRSAP